MSNKDRSKGTGSKKGKSKSKAHANRQGKDAGRGGRFPYDVTALMFAAVMASGTLASQGKVRPLASLKEADPLIDGALAIVRRTLPLGASFAAWIPKINAALSNGDAENIVFIAYAVARVVRGLVDPNEKIKPEVHEEIWAEVWRAIEHKDAIKAQAKAATPVEPFQKWQSKMQGSVPRNFRTLLKSTSPIMQRKADKIKSRVEEWLPTTRFVP